MKENLTIYMISGKAQHGKTSIAKMIKDYYKERGNLAVITSFNRYIKMYAKDISDWDGKEETKPRKLLQTLGTEVIREKLGKNEMLIKRIDEDMDIYNEYAMCTIIDDVRLPLEYEYFENKYPNKVKKIHVDRPNFQNGLNEAEQAHSTEVGLDNYTDYDYTITNDGTLEELKTKVYEMMGEMQK